MDRETTATPSNGVIILRGTQNYLEWLYTIEMTAKSSTQEVWSYIDPSHPATERTSIPSVSDRPKPKDIAPSASSVSQISSIQVEDFKIRLAEWKEKKAEVDEVKRLMGAIQNKVLGSISERLLPQLKGKSTLADILLYPNKRFRPTDQSRRQEIISKWNKLKENPANNSIMSWLDQWELVYSDAKELDLPHVIDPQAQYDFLYTIRSFDGP